MVPANIRGRMSLDGAKTHQKRGHLSNPTPFKIEGTSHQHGIGQKVSPDHIDQDLALCRMVRLGNHDFLA